MTDNTLISNKGKVLAQGTQVDGEEKREYLRQLVEHAQTGDKGAFEELYKHKLRSILYNIGSYIKNPTEVEDVAQEVGLIVYKKLPELRNPEAFNAWLGRIVTNECYRVLRGTNKRDQELDIDDFEDIICEENKEFLPEEFAESRELREIILRTISKLPSQRKRMIIMYFYDDLSYKEIAEAMDVAISSVSTGIMRAKKMIKEDLEKEMKKNPTMGKAGAAGTVVGAALEFEAIGLYPDASIASIMGSFTEKLANNVPIHSRKKLRRKNEVKQLAKTAAITVASVAIATSAGVFMVGAPIVPADAIEAPAEVSTPYEPVQPVSPASFEIGFVSDECVCGHLNPTSASITGEGELGAVRYKITKVGSFDIVAEGTGADVSAELTGLYAAGKDGDYDLQFDFESKDGYDYTLNRVFTINTGVIEAGEYL
ncbi:MAG: sigma-70 family RNA polymerase sigma factor [Clostridiales Family XIII bacterium]|jgi:RNA polymerase sigma-70 factor (ECF subfamily)|nr:sigma-70 family RNA polymerase sigma factor [Clostridiales Family XIII bacterium]